MRIGKIEHYNIRTEKLADTVRFYTEVLGFTNGKRPGNPKPNTGAWLYNDEGVPVVHVTAIDRNDPERLKWVNEYLGHRDLDSLNGSGSIDHVAFSGVGYDEVLARCRTLNVAARERLVEALSLRQLFVTDPNGISIELNFYGD
jgi:catechol 2,3-dioxygenase-like lactoylglutathione lyase family enzyme